MANPVKQDDTDLYQASQGRMLGEALAEAAAIRQRYQRGDITVDEAERLISELRRRKSGFFSRLFE